MIVFGTATTLLQSMLSTGIDSKSIQIQSNSFKIKDLKSCRRLDRTASPSGSPATRLKLLVASRLIQEDCASLHRHRVVLREGFPCTQRIGLASLEAAS